MEGIGQMSRQMHLRNPYRKKKAKFTNVMPDLLFTHVFTKEFTSSGQSSLSRLRNRSSGQVRSIEKGEKPLTQNQWNQHSKDDIEPVEATNLIIFSTFIEFITNYQR